MTLQFQQHINNQPTYFVEKIWNNFPDPSEDFKLLDFIEKSSKEYEAECIGLFQQKKHTIRADKNNRWVKGTNIHFKTWSGRPYHSKNINFAPIIKVVSTQKIEILYKDIDGFKLEVATVYVDGVWLPGDEVEVLAINDGFDNIEDFFAYFNKNFTGKIIHWTNLKY